MEQKSFLTITTPYQILIKEAVDYVTIPGIEGEFGILPAHEPMISALKSGIITVLTGSKQQKFFTSQGIIKIENSEIGLLVDFGINIKDVTQQEIIQKIANLTNELNNIDDLELSIVLSKNIQQYESLLIYL
ncbi:MAG: ATP synthase F1 subunit epsilon [Rickettsiaceae bacterium]|nr:MAG: ATP synthase F1 subunit epsilon [Rickettsiaceae bacterium]